MTTTTIRSDTATVNGTELYYELRGDGPSIMFVSGGFGDAAGWETTGGDAGEELHRASATTAEATHGARDRPAGPPRRSTSRPTTPPPCSGPSTWRPPRCTGTAWAPTSASTSCSATPGWSATPSSTSRVLTTRSTIPTRPWHRSWRSWGRASRPATCAAPPMPCCASPAVTRPTGRSPRTGSTACWATAETLLEIELAGDASIDMAALARCTVPRDGRRGRDRAAVPHHWFAQARRAAAGRAGHRPGSARPPADPPARAGSGDHRHPAPTARLTPHPARRSTSRRTRRRVRWRGGQGGGRRRVRVGRG